VALLKSLKIVEAKNVAVLPEGEDLEVDYRMIYVVGEGRFHTLCTNV